MRCLAAADVPHGSSAAVQQPAVHHCAGLEVVGHAMSAVAKTPLHQRSHQIHGHSVAAAEGSWVLTGCKLDEGEGCGTDAENCPQSA